MTICFFKRKPFLYLFLLSTILFTSATAHAQNIGYGNLELSVGPAFVVNGGSNDTTSSVTAGTTFSGYAEVSGVQGNQGTTYVDCYDTTDGTTLVSWATQTGGETSFSWTPRTIGTHMLYCSGTWDGEHVNGTVYTGYAYVPVVQASSTGFISPKYKIVGIAYSVPGTSSYVQYTNTTMMGTSTSTNSSFSANVTTSESVCGATGSSVCGQGNGVSITGTYTNAFTQESDTSSSFAVNQTTSFVNKLSPLTSSPPLDHGNDVIYIWVNPNVWYTVTTPGAPLQWNGLTYDLSDDSNDMEVIPLRLSELLNPSTIDSYTQGRLKRAWALKNTDGSSPAITNQDLLNIAAQDPFSNPNYAVTLGSDYQTSTDGRFTLSANQSLFYTAGDTNTYNWSYTGTAVAGQGAKTTYSDGFSLEEKFAGSFFWQAVSYDLKQSTTFTWLDQWNKTTTNMTGQAATVQIVGPAASCNCDGEYNVYVDNIYGTFMVYPVPNE